MKKQQKKEQKKFRCPECGWGSTVFVKRNGEAWCRHCGWTGTAEDLANATATKK